MQVVPFDGARDEPPVPSGDDEPRPRLRLVDRRGRLRRLEDCVALLEAARALGATRVTRRVADAIAGRLPAAAVGTEIDAALELARSADPGAPGEDKRVRHRRPAFDHRLLLGDLFPWRP